MSKEMILICDGCEMASTSRKPVVQFTLHQVFEDEQKVIIEGDAHDWNCFGRIISRRRKAIREAVKAEKAGGAKSSKK